MKHLQLEDSSNVIWIYFGIDFHCKITPPPPPPPPPTHTHTVERQQAIKQALSFPVTYPPPPPLSAVLLCICKTLYDIALASLWNISNWRIRPTWYEFTLVLIFIVKLPPPPPHTHTHTQWKDNRQLNKHSLFLWLNQLFHRSYARIMGEVSFGDIWYILTQCHAKGSRLIMQLINHGRGCPCFILALLKLKKGIYIVISWNNGSAVLTLQNDNQTLCYAVSLNVFIR